MYISDLDYLELPLKQSHYSHADLVQGGIDFTAFAFAFTEAETTAITFAVTKTAAVSLGFNSFGL